MTDPYLVRRRHRLASSELTQNVTFGIVLGWMLVLFGLHHYLSAVVVGTDWLLLTVPAGGLVLLLTAAVPSLFAWPRKGISRVANFAGLAVLTMFLAVVYILLIVPTALLQRWFYGRAPYYAWRGTPPPKVEGWIRCESGAATAANVRGLLLPRLFFATFAHFIRQRRIPYLPALLVLLIVGIVLFFAHSSAIAPLIYTLF